MLSKAHSCLFFFMPLASISRGFKGYTCMNLRMKKKKTKQPQKQTKIKPTKKHEKTNQTNQPNKTTKNKLEQRNAENENHL